MEFLEVVKTRHCVRSYQDKALTKKQIDGIFQVIERTPSAGNLRAFRIMTVTDSETKIKIAQSAFDQMWIVQAPILFILIAQPQISSAKYGERGHFYSICDAVIAGAYLQLAATNLGLSTGWVGAFNNAQLSAILKIQDPEFPIAIIPCGYKK